jgi:hypothetical protein
MSLVLRGLTWWQVGAVLSFLHDVLALGKDFQSHLDNLREVFLCFQEFDLKFRPKKCELFHTRVEFFGRQVRRRGIEMGDAYISAVLEWAVPSSAKKVERFLGFANYDRAFIARCAELANPLYSVTVKKPFRGPEQQSLRGAD